MNALSSLRPGDALLVVDMQNDFCQGGALPVYDSDAMLPVLDVWLQAARRAAIPVYASRDWHPEGHCSFQQSGGTWPRHCVQGTDGARFHPALPLLAEAEIISKGTARDRDAYSAFDGTDLAARLAQRGVRRLFVGGVASDVCVRASVLDALAAGFEVHVIAAATRPVDAQQGPQALAEMAEAGAVIDEDLSE